MTARHLTLFSLAAGLALATSMASRAQPPDTTATPNVPSAESRIVAPPPATAETAPPLPPVSPGAGSAPTEAAPPTPYRPENVTLVPVPTIPEIQRRSGLVRRFVPIEPNLPHDPRRDDWYDTRYGDAPNLRKHPNFYPNGGLYGLPWKAEYTQSYDPYFYGSPGRGTINEEGLPKHNIWRLPRMLFHPFKPVGMYYDQGSYVPVYDLDPLVPGPGAWPWPFFRRLTSAGG